MRNELSMKDFKARMTKGFARHFRLGYLKTFSSLDAMRHHKEELISEIANLHYEREILKLENLEIEEKKKNLEASLSDLKSDISSINIKNRLSEKRGFIRKKEKHKIDKKTLFIQIIILLVIIFSVFYHDDFFKFYREDRQVINEYAPETSMYGYYDHGIL